jgi:PAS domain S-box-containing protein
MNTSQANNKYFEILLDNSIVSKSDLDGNITYVNENFVKATGFSKEESIGYNHNILRHPSTSNAVFKEMWKTIKSGQVFRANVLSRKKDSSDFWAETIIIPLLGDDGTIIEYIAIRKDITEFLEQKKLSEAKDSFLLLFTHELKTPLNAIINFSRYILKTGCDNIPYAKRKKLLEQIELSALKMFEDVTQLLELSKLKSNRLTYNITVFNIFDAINDVLEEHASLAKEHGVAIYSCTSDNGCYTKSDIYRIKQILANIISNAIKYSNSKVRLHVECRSDECDIIIDDDGDSIKNKEKIFELFEQDGNKLKDKKGTGIGLSFVKYLCQDLDIKYKLEDSKELGGLSFKITLKLIKEKS